jgi:uncharacterized protein YbjT (DUF2867 family)
MKKILVIDGNIGSHVAEGLAKKGVPVRVLTRTVKPNAKWEELGVEQVAGDMASIDSLAPAFQDVDSFFSVTPYVENLVELGTNAVEAAKRAGVSYIVRSSLMHASELSITLRQWHCEVEKAIETSGIRYTILQPNTFMQSLLMNAETVKSANALFMPQGDGKVSLVDVRDIAAVAVACLMESGHEGKKYTVTGGEALSNAEIAERLTKLQGRTITYYDVSPEQAGESMTTAGLPAWMVQTLLELFEVCKAGDCAEVSPVIEQILERKPISFDQFLSETADAFRPATGEVAGAA